MLQRTYLLATGLAIATIAALFLLNRTPAQPARPANAEVAVAKAGQPVRDDQPSARMPLPIGQVVLFSSGVGYFQREGSVEGNARVDLQLPRHRHQRPAQVDGAARPRRRPHLHRLLRLQRSRRTHLKSLRHQPDRQSHLRRHPQPGPRRKGRGRPAADQRHPARHHVRHRRRHREAEGRRRQGHGRRARC